MHQLLHRRDSITGALAGLNDIDERPSQVHNRETSSTCERAAEGRADRTELSEIRRVARGMTVQDVGSSAWLGLFGGMALEPRTLLSRAGHALERKWDILARDRTEIARRCNKPYVGRRLFSRHLSHDDSVSSLLPNRVVVLNSVELRGVDVA